MTACPACGLATAAVEEHMRRVHNSDPAEWSKPSDEITAKVLTGSDREVVKDSGLVVVRSVDATEEGGYL